ncbi:SDR family NAD(P)-dependent oxidoreductase [Robbsia andropogonis]|uniref:SDR family NAD(P)-dependent oxidoreductase n=1 Tax=Robbsia andropogonis TaxID=28092 RepID=UPI000463B523|nr:SDR family NAD(P)-dependent oxidoreductase [Robbsia andropogonis]
MNTLQQILQDLKSGQIDKAESLHRLKAELDGATVQSMASVCLYTPEWREAPLESEPIAPVAGAWLILLDASLKAASVDVAQLPGYPRSQVLVQGEGDIGQRYEALAAQVLEAVREPLREPVSTPLLVQLVVVTVPEDEALFGLAALLRTIEQENPRVRTQVISVDSGRLAAKDLAVLLATERAHRSAAAVRYRDGKRAALRYVALPETATAAPPPWREGGVYLFTGGAGGLAALFASEILRHAPQAHVVLTSRSPWTAADRAALKKLGPQLHLRVLDVTDAAAVEAVLHGLQRKFGTLTGILHAAGVRRDGFALHKQVGDIATVCAPKVRGLLNLERASRALPLELFVSFSSIAGVLGNVGQADYALANAFLDHRAMQARRSVSINWPLWTDGGMQVDAETLRALRDNLGLVPIGVAQGFSAFYQALACKRAQVVVAAGDLIKFLGLLNQSEYPGFQKYWGPSGASTVEAVESPSLLPTLLARLKAVFAECTRYRPEKLDALEPLETYGIDSLMITRLNQRLAKIYDGLPKTLLYEHRTLAALANYLLAQHTVSSQRWCGVDAVLTDAVDPVVHESSHTAPNAMAVPSKARDHAIAIIGMSGRYPKAASLTEFWHNLREGLDCVDEIPPDRWPLEGFFEPDRKKAVAQGKSYGKWGGFIDGFAEFDPLFFGISPREAMAMDPQERLFMQACWDALEDAAITKETLEAQYGCRVGVYAGITKTGFNLYGPALWRDGETLHPRTSFSSVANRVSYALNLNGPSMPLDTMCSSSLTAIHHACQALRDGDCALAIAGGVNLYLHPSSFVELSASQMLSSDGRCKSFGAGGNGFVPGEGVGCLLLKPLAQAQADGDQIHALIISSHVNHGGKTHGYTVPNPAAQRALVRTAFEKAAVSARSIGFLEAHGTGTEMGDPIEIEALTQAFRSDTEDVGFCAIGSAKSNVGHLEAAAGIAGLTKIVLQMKHRRLVPSLHADTVNPNIDFEDTPFVLQRTLAPWRRMSGPQGEWPLRAAVSSFGAGGANAHIVLEEYVVTPTPVQLAGVAPSAIVLSARTETALRGRAARLLTFLNRIDVAPAFGIEGVIAGYLATLLHVATEQIEPDIDLAQYGVGEFELLRLLERLKEDAGLAFPDASWRECRTVAELATLLTPTTIDGASLEDIAYTLQVGREPMAYRLACVVRSVPELTAKLEQYLAGDTKFEGFYLGQVTQSGERLEALERAVGDTDIATRARLWVDGQHTDWASLHQGARPRRVSLPTYPYARDTYWIAEKYRDGGHTATTTAAITPPPSLNAPAHAAEQTLGLLATEVTIEVHDFIKQTLVNKLCESLDLRPDEVHPDQSFADYGLDSILGVQLVDSLNAALDLQLETTCLFDYSSVNRLKAFLVSQYTGPAAPSSGTQRYVPGLAPLPANEHVRNTPARDNDIAIIGISGRFGRSDDVNSLWEHLVQGHNLIKPVTRWPLPDENTKPDLCRHGSFIEGIEEFDPLFFNISGVEATYMDPQQRHFLQEAWKALENAGYASTQIAGTDCGVYVGCCSGDYQDLFRDKPSAQSLWGNMASVIPSRIAYYLDLKGPTLSIDSACSSSLVAIDLACKDLRSGETSMALAGGVFLQATPKLYSAANSAGMLSTSGRCHTFDASADGFVPGEGVGVLVLKRLSQAFADGDHIYGVIVGSGTNQDGTTNGITAPSGKSQEALLRRIYDRFGIDAGEIQMMEAHGTGTRLGDPIEFGALTKAFRADSDERQYCALGSIKTNLGHSQYAAGVAGVIKVLLSLQHQLIPPSLNYRQGNPAIQFEQSPFFVNTQLLPWPATSKRRMAAISSFGLGGSNAHLVIAEAPGNTRRHREASAYLITLSARGQPQLRRQVEQMLAYCRSFPETDCGNLSFTLLMGRKHFENRLAWVVSSIEDLTLVLASWLEEAQPPAPASPDSTTSQAYLHELSLLAAAYCSGAVPDFASLFAAEGYSRLPLPTYPFKRDRYWVSDETMAALAEPLNIPKAGNTSRIRFAGDEFFLLDHMVCQQHILPGVISLELARRAFAARTEQQFGVRLSDVVWLRPVAIRQAIPELTLELTPLADNRFEFRISDVDQTDHVYTQGFVQALAASSPQVDLTAVRASCSLTHVSGQQCYKALRNMGIEHGPRLQAVAEIQVGVDLALARLSMPVGTTDSSYLLHPSILDSAIQSSIGLLLGESQSARTALPFALEALEVYAPCTVAMWAVVRRGNKRVGLEKFDIDLCDETGMVCVRMQGYSSRLLDAVPQADQTFSLMLQPVWDAQSLPAAQTFVGRMVLVGGDTEVRNSMLRICPQLRFLTLDAHDSIDQISAKLAGLGEFDHLLWIGDRHTLPDEWSDELLNRQQRGTIAAFRLLKAMLANGCDARKMHFTVLTTQALPADHLDPVHPVDAGLHGLFGSLAKEYPHWGVRIVDLEAGSDIPFEAILGLPFDARGDSWVLRKSQWHRLSLLEQISQEESHGLSRHSGVYVVIGGAGGVGAAWSEYMIRRYQARIIWIGRRPADARITDRLATLGRLGPRPHYVVADATDRHALQAAAGEIRRLFGTIHGVVHSTIVLQDQALARMDEQRFLASYRAKADVAVRMAQVFGGEPLDFILFFSSIQSFARMPGQNNYAAGSTFNDTFAHFIDRHLGVNCKVMNWGYWGTVGVVASPDYQQRMAQAGLASIETPEAMAALESLLASPGRQAALVKATRLPAIEAMSMDQRVTVYREELPPLVCLTLQDFQSQQEQVLAMRTKVGSQMSEMDTLLATLLLVQLREAGLFLDAGSSVADTRSVMPPLYQRWMDESILVLLRHGLLRVDGDVYVPVRALDAAAAWRAWDHQTALWLQDKNRRAQVQLVEIMLRALPDIIAGKRLATDAMFPNSSLKLVEGIYKNNLVADYFNEVMSDVLLAHLEQRLARDPEARIRILEIGAGTGGTSAVLFPKLQRFQANIEEYCYTDLSKAFLMHADREYGADNPYLTYRLFDVSKPLAGQNIPSGGFDVVIATNVLHATRNIRNTIRNAKAAMRRNGLLLLNELSDNVLFSHLTFGLLEGWWLYDDAELRIPGSPGLYPRVWQQVLESEGFHSLAFPAEAAHIMGQQVIVAESNGVVRQSTALAHSPGAATQTAATLASPTRTASGPIRIAAAVKPAQQAATDRQVQRDKARHYFKQLVSDTIRIPADQIETSVPLERYGIDSILVVQLTSQLRKVFSNIGSTLFFEVPTIDDLINHFEQTQPQSLAKLVVGVDIPDQASASFPELIQMNSVVDGRPVFWIHHANGGIEAYQAIAQRCQRPFYGIRPKGYIEGDILVGQQARGSYYASIIRAVQPEGPYDIGGFSLGGLLAYEVVRQLQLQGAEVATLVMLDALDAQTTNRANALVGCKQTEVEKISKANAFRAVNLMLGNNDATLMLHRDNVDTSLKYPEFLDSLITSAFERGANKNKAQIHDRVLQLSRYFDAIQSEHYEVLPLPHRDAVRCYYFRNRNGILFGSNLPFMVLHDNADLPVVDSTNYWNEWSQQIDDFYIIDVDIAIHYDMLVAPQSLKKILRLCDELYESPAIESINA